jgi:hypothetical protein
MLRNVAKNRERDRFPVATYLYKTDSEITTCLWRSSQIKSNCDKWLSDIEYISYLSDGKNDLTIDTRLIVLDARSKQTAKNM